ncbi:hypothetical protein HDV03_005473 [Kappamyces sp. JEL0829]|nr:hypothetical protein HDV03_005473 [Kappamyces sp. JEL0829]
MKEPITKQSIEQFTALIETRNSSDSDLRKSLKKLRLLILKNHGIPDCQTRHGSMRACVWKILLGVYRIDSIEYMGLIQRGPCEVWEKIQNDVFRTLATDADFTKQVSHDMISRLLHAFVWKTQDQPKSRLINLSFSYVQGMNVLAAPFLYVMPELESFACFTAFILNSCPLYVQPALEGVHCGVKLLDVLLIHFHPTLHSHLLTHGAETQVYAFPWIMTFSACTPPLQQVLKLWDFYLAYGIHLHILTLVHVLIKMENELLECDRYEPDAFLTAR